MTAERQIGADRIICLHFASRVTRGVNVKLRQATIRFRVQPRIWGVHPICGIPTLSYYLPKCVTGTINNARIAAVFSASNPFTLGAA